MTRVGIIGVGKIGGALFTELAASERFELGVADARPDHLAKLSETPGVWTTSSNAELAENSDLAILAVKPWDVEPVLKQVSASLEGAGKAVVSVAAGVTIDSIASLLPQDTGVLRVMPNVCASVGLGSAVVAANEAGEAAKPVVMEIFGSVGEVMELPERLFDAATALHGSGPAYVALFADSLVQAGVQQGVPRDIARRLVNSTLRGTVELLEQKSAHEVRDEVMTPGGTTAAAYAAMEKSGFVAAVYEGIAAAAEQARRLGE